MSSNENRQLKRITKHSWKIHQKKRKYIYFGVVCVKSENSELLSEARDGKIDKKR